MLTSLAENGLDLIRRDDLRVIILVLIELHRETGAAGLSRCGVKVALLTRLITASDGCDDVGDLTAPVVNQIRSAVDVDRLGVIKSNADSLIEQLLLATVVLLSNVALSISNDLVLYLEDVHLPVSLSARLSLADYS